MAGSEKEHDKHLMAFSPATLKDQGMIIER